MYSRICGEGFGLVMMRVDIDDAEILVAALDRLLGGVGEERRGVELLRARRRGRLTRIHRRVSVISGGDFGVGVGEGMRLRLPRLVQDCHRPSSNTSELTRFEHRRAADHHVGRGDAAFAREGRRRLAVLRLGRIEPHARGEELADRIVGDVDEAVLVDRLREAPTARSRVRKSRAPLRRQMATYTSPLRSTTLNFCSRMRGLHTCVPSAR